MKKTVQDFLVEIKSIKKTQMNVHLETKNLGTKQGPQRQVSPTEYKMEERFSDFEDKIEAMDTLAKENVKSTHIQTPIIQEICSTTKRPNL